MVHVEYQDSISMQNVKSCNKRQHRISGLEKRVIELSHEDYLCAVCPKEQTNGWVFTF